MLRLTPVQRLTILLPAWLLTALCTATSALGHHGASSFDGDTELRLEGVVIEFDYRNPHSFVHLRTTDSAGNPVDIAIEAQGSSLRPYGVTPDSLAAGDRVVAVVNPSFRSPDQVLGREIIKADGTVVPLAWQAARSHQASTGVSTSIAGIWLADPVGFTAYVRGFGSWPLTERGQQAREAYDARLISQARCIPFPPPLLMLYRSINVVEVLSDRVLIHSDWMDAERVIYTDGRSPAADEIPALHGFSAGRWENDTLIAETGHFSENYAGNNFRVPSSPQKHLVERFSLADDGSRLEYSYVMEDPEYLAAPVTGATSWDYRPDLTPDDVPCDLESAGHYLNE